MINPKVKIKIKTLYPKIDNSKTIPIHKSYSLRKIKPRNILNHKHLTNQPISNAYISNILNEKAKENEFLRHSNCCLDFHPKWKYSYNLSKNNLSSSVNNFYTKIKDVIKKPKILISSISKPKIIQILEKNGQVYEKINLNPWKYKPVFWENNYDGFDRSRNLNISINKIFETKKKQLKEIPSVKITKIQFHHNYHSENNSKNKRRIQKELSNDNIKNDFLSPQNNLLIRKDKFKISEKETENNDLIDEDKYDMDNYIMDTYDKKLKNVEIDNDNKTTNNTNIIICQNDSKYEKIKIKKNKMIKDASENTIL